MGLLKPSTSEDSSSWAIFDQIIIIIGNTFDFPECLRSEPFDCLVSLDDEAHGGELAAAVAQELVGQVVGELLLEPERLEPREGGADAKVQLLQ